MKTTNASRTTVGAEINFVIFLDPWLQLEPCYVQITIFLSKVEQSAFTCSKLTIETLDQGV